MPAVMTVATAAASAGPEPEMPPMTMQFQVRDAALLQGLQEGSRIRFAAERINGQYTVTVVQPAP